MRRKPNRRNNRPRPHRIIENKLPNVDELVDAILDKNDPSDPDFYGPDQEIHVQVDPTGFFEVFIGEVPEEFVDAGSAWGTGLLRGFDEVSAEKAAREALAELKRDMMEALRVIRREKLLKEDISATKRVPRKRLRNERRRPRRRR